jgi:hypothetical protein
MTAVFKKFLKANVVKKEAAEKTRRHALHVNRQAICGQASGYPQHEMCKSGLSARPFSFVP